jgi:hypothetical protein
LSTPQLNDVDLHLFMIAVDHRHKGRKVAHNLVRACLQNGARKGYHTAVTEATGVISQHIFRSGFGFPVLSVKRLVSNDRRRGFGAARQGRPQEAGPTAKRGPPGSLPRGSCRKSFAHDAMRRVIHCGQGGRPKPTGKPASFERPAELHPRL